MFRDLRPYPHYTDEKLVAGYERAEQKIDELMFNDADETLIHNNQWVLFHLGAEMDLRGLTRLPYDWESTL